MNTLRNIIFLIAIITISSCYRNPVERNTIVFKDDVRNVQDSLDKMLKLLPLLPKSPDSLNTLYTIENGRLYVNPNYSKGTIKQMRDALNHFTFLEKRDFTRLAFYLNKNYITSAYFDESLSLWRFIYREIPEKTFDDSRDIVILNEAAGKSIKSTHHVLDKHDRIYLIAPIDAEIR